MSIPRQKRRGNGLEHKLSGFIYVRAAASEPCCSDEDVEDAGCAVSYTSALCHLYRIILWGSISHSVKEVPVRSQTVSSKGLSFKTNLSNIGLAERSTSFMAEPYNCSKYILELLEKSMKGMSRFLMPTIPRSGQ